MKKVIEKKLEITSNNRDVDILYQEFFSMDKNIAEFKFTIDNLAANKVICLFYFKQSKRYSTVETTIVENAFTVKFDTSLITIDEPVVGYVYFEKVEESADVYSFQFNVRVSELDKSKTAPVIEQKTGRVVDIESIVTKAELEEILKTVHIESAENDNSEIIKRLAALEAKPEIDTSQFATKEELQNISLTPGPKGENGRDGVGIPQKLSLDGNTIILSDGGGSVTLPSQPATSASAGQASEYEIRGTGSPEGRITAEIGTTYVDVNVTNGALKWIKESGSGNTGWRVLIGDTGWKTLPIINKRGNAKVQVRRINDEIVVKFDGLDWGWFGVDDLQRQEFSGNVVEKTINSNNYTWIKLNAGQGNQVLPEGFRSASSLLSGLYGDLGDLLGSVYVGGKEDSNAIQLRYAMDRNALTSNILSQIRISPVVFTTDDPWPTKLP